jgi:hypothetical protein
MTSILTTIVQLVENELPVVDLFLPIVESGLGTVLDTAPAVFSTPAIQVKVGAHVYSASIVFSKVS